MLPNIEKDGMQEKEVIQSPSNNKLNSLSQSPKKQKHLTMDAKLFEDNK